MSRPGTACSQPSTNWGHCRRQGGTDAEEARRRDNESWAMSCARERKQLTGHGGGDQAYQAAKPANQLNQL